ncbi:Membrane-bound metal-dependent hydrolase YbcI, DUF457 family [Halapricum desulfuricans]|uniref:Membrane-bound metal-dependent hydrolase YbcI, DUF457 family n=1 Tax=Halapricum desulfuricans TaxID=2841257 RepID=A0A897NK69_9EURY|nr:Membrane-bound metal-dependent hydrolase YbcI, DUF457 family [Halapricum desulfuricans]
MFAVPLVIAVVLVARRFGSVSHVAAFAVGYASHLAGDLLYPLAVGNYWELNILLWPITPTVLYDTQPSVLWHLSTIKLTPVFVAELALGVFVVAIWVFDGMPLLRETVELFRRSNTSRK